MDTSPIRSRTRAGAQIPNLPTQSTEDRVPHVDITDTQLDVTGEELWPEYGTVEDYVPDVLYNQNCMKSCRKRRSQMLLEVSWKVSL
jgi:hypothetical protein